MEKKIREPRSDYLFLGAVRFLVSLAGLITFCGLCVSVGDPLRYLQDGVSVWSTGFSLESSIAAIAGGKLWRTPANTVCVTVSGTTLGVILVVSDALGTLHVVIARFCLETGPVELEESARTDGANKMRILFSVCLPPAKPIVAAADPCIDVGCRYPHLGSLLYVADSLGHPVRVYLARIIIRGEEPNVARLSPDAQRASLITAQAKHALVVLWVLPVMMVYPFVQKYLVKGMLLGCLRG